jgi:hypothetical protein
MFNFARQLQLRRLARAARAAALSTAVLLLAVLAAAAGARAAAGVLLFASAGLGLRARHWLELARRAGIGADSEHRVKRALKPLEAEGWRVRHSLPWNGRGDIDTIATAPTGSAFAIETKTRTYTPEHLARTREIADCLSSRRRRWCPNGALPVLCIVRAGRLERVENEVLVVSLERLAPALRTAARSRDRPAFLRPAPSRHVSGTGD